MTFLYLFETSKRVRSVKMPETEMEVSEVVDAILKSLLKRRNRLAVSNYWIIPQKGYEQIIRNRTFFGGHIWISSNLRVSPP